MKKVDLTTGREFSVIIMLALPLIGNSLLQFLYNFIDMLFVGRLGSGAIAAVGSASFFINLGYAAQSLIVMGGGIKVAHALGRKDDINTSIYISNSLFMNSIIGIFTAFLLFLYGNHILHFLDLNDYDVQHTAYQYLAISGLTMFFGYFNTFFIRMFNSFGNNKQSFYINGSGILLNIMLDPFFIYTCKLGVMGAALATFVAQIVVFMSFLFVARTVLWNCRLFHLSMSHCKEIIFLGTPIATQRVLFTFINIILAKIIASFGTEAIAAQKIGFQLESMIYIVLGGFYGAVSSFIGQNFGALQMKRISTGYRVSMMIAIGYAILMTLVFITFSEPLSRLFTDDVKTISIASSYLIIIGLSQVFMAMEMIGNGAFSGIGLPKYPSYISIIFTSLRIPLALLLAPVMGIQGVWWSIAISSVMKGIVSYIVFQVVFKRRYPQHGF